MAVSTKRRVNRGAEVPWMGPLAGAVAGVEIAGLTFSFGEQEILSGVDLKVPAGSTMALAGPPRSGKTTLLRCINRMHEGLWGTRETARAIKVLGSDVREMAGDQVRRRVGMVFPSPTTFPLSVYENVACALSARLPADRDEIDTIVEEALRKTGLWEDVKDRLACDARTLSEGRQQCLCIARALAAGPSVLLLDDPYASLDPASEARLEGLLERLKGNVTVLLAVRDLKQAACGVEHVVFFLNGRLVECPDPRTIVGRSHRRLTEIPVFSRLG